MAAVQADPGGLALWFRLQGDPDHIANGSFWSTLGGMSNEDLSQIFEENLRAQAELDRSYYLNPNPSREEREAYHRRIEQAEKLRQHFYLALHSLPATASDPAAFQVLITDQASARTLSSPQCPLGHELKNGLHIVLGYADLLSKRLSEDDAAMTELDHLRSAASKMADLVKSSRCKGNL